MAIRRQCQKDGNMLLPIPAGMYLDWPDCAESDCIEGCRPLEKHCERIEKFLKQRMARESQ